MRVAEGDRAGARNAYEESLEIQRRLAGADPGNAEWARDLSLSLVRIGDVRVAEATAPARCRPTRKAWRSEGAWPHPIPATPAGRAT